MDNTESIKQQIVSQESKIREDEARLQQLRVDLEREKERVARVNSAALEMLQKCPHGGEHDWLPEEYKEDSVVIGRHWVPGYSRGFGGYSYRDDYSYDDGYYTDTYKTTFKSELKCKKCGTKASLARG